MENRILKILGVLLAVGLIVPCRAADTPDAGELLHRALEYTCNDAVFKCEKVIWGGKTISQGRLLGFRGRLRFERLVPSGLQIKLMPATPRGGFFVWMEVNGNIPGDTVIESTQTEIIDYFAFLRAQLVPKRFDSGEYRIRDIGDSWRIEALYPATDDYIMHTSTQNFAFNLVPGDLQMREDFLIEDLTPVLFHRNADGLRRAYYSSLVFFINKDPADPLVFAYQADNISGEHLRAFQMKSVESPAELDESLFAPPAGTSIVKVTSADEYWNAWSAAGYPSTGGGDTEAQNSGMAPKKYMGYIIVVLAIIVVLLAAKFALAFIRRRK